MTDDDKKALTEKFKETGKGMGASDDEATRCSEKAVSHVMNKTAFDYWFNSTFYPLIIIGKFVTILMKSAVLAAALKYLGLL